MGLRGLCYELLGGAQGCAAPKKCVFQAKERFKNARFQRQNQRRSPWGSTFDAATPAFERLAHPPARIRYNPATSNSSDHHSATTASSSSFFLYPMTSVPTSFPPCGCGYATTVQHTLLH